MYKNIYFSFNGRISRKEYFFLSILPLLVAVPLTVTSISAYYALGKLGTGSLPLTLIILAIALILLLMTAPTVKRLHDIATPGWLVLAVFIPYLNLLILLALLIIPGSPNQNRYGKSAPKQHQNSDGNEFRKPITQSLWKPTVANLLLSLIAGVGSLAGTIYHILYAEPIKTDELLAVSAPTDFPQIVLTNAASFKGHTSLYGASAFLAADPQGKPLLITARHLIGDSGGVSPEIEPVDLDSVIEHWIAHPRTQPEKSIRITGNFLPTMASTTLDVLALNTAEKPNLPAQVLNFRKHPPKLGEIVYIAGCEYADLDCLQRIWPAQIVEITGAEPYASYDMALKNPIELAGFSGAPVIDTEGNALAVVTSGWKEDDQGRYHFASADSIEMVRTGGTK